MGKKLRRGSSLLTANPAPKHCGQHMRRSPLPKTLNIKGLSGDCWKCHRCGTVTIKGNG